MITLFEYGQLRTRDNVYTARGVLRAFIDEDGPDAAAQFDANAPGLVYGSVRVLKQYERLRLDKSEQPEFRRKGITLTDGRHVYAYVCVLPSWSEMELIPSGDWFRYRR